MGKFMEPDPDVYNPTKAKDHPWADLFRDIPLSWRKVPNPKGGFVFQPAGPGVLTTPIAPAAFATHVQLCGFKLVEAERKVQRIDPLRGGRSLTSPGIWQDITLPVPEGSPVHAVVATAAASGMTPAELLQASEQLRAAAEAQAR